MKLTLTALTVTAAMFASSASAFDPDDLQKLLDTRECRYCDLANVNLRFDVAGGDPFLIINLASANLASADLTDANLQYTDLTDANLSRVKMIGTDLSNTDLTGANLSGAVLRDADLTSAMMNGVTLCNTTMPDGSVIYSGC